MTQKCRFKLWNAVSGCYKSVKIGYRPIYFVIQLYLNYDYVYDYGYNSYDIDMCIKTT